MSTAGNSHRAGDTEPPAELLVGTVLSDRYRIDALVGEGGMGRVYGATHVAMRKRVAVKVLRRELTEVTEVVKRFEREAMAAANINHPNVATATDFGKLDDGSVYLVLEFVEGRSLRDEIDAGPLSLERTLHIIRQMASALASAHELEIVHRDLKPENVMLVEKGADRDFVKVLDFGIAKMPTAEAQQDATARTVEAITRVGMVYGTPEYMPPEQAIGQAVDQRADLYAVGVTMFEMLAGRRPFEAESHAELVGKQLREEPPALASVGVTVPPVVEQLVRALLAREADRRVQRAVDLTAAIDRIRGRPGSIPDPGSGSIPDGVVSSPELLGVGSAPLLPLSAALPPVPGAPDDAAPSLLGSDSLPDADAAPGVATWFENLKPALPAPLRTLPPAAVIGAALFALAAFVFLVGTLVASAVAGATAAPAASTEVAGAVPVATAAASADIETAKKAGASALLALSEKHPDDARVLVEVAKAQALERQVDAAVGTIGRALALSSSVADDPAVGSLLWRAAQDKQAQAAAFALLETSMGARGADILYDLWVTEGVRGEVARRAEKYLQSQAFQRVSSPALNVAVALRDAKTCEQKHALLLRARNQGDARSLKYLRQLEAKTGCGRTGSKDCWPCVREDERLREAIEAIEKRKQ